MNLTLYQIEDELAQLIAHRAERLADTADPPSAEELAVLDSEINKYEIREPAKVARVASMLRMWKAQRANNKAERDRLRAIDGILEAMETRLKERIAAVMELLPEPPAGKSRRLNGAEGSALLLKRNGSLEPLQVDGWDPDARRWLRDSTLPDEFMDTTVTLPLHIWRRMCEAFGCPSSGPGDTARAFEEPANDRIRLALAQPCSACMLAQQVAEIVSGVPPAQQPKPICLVCGGTGKNGIPGARLLPRGSHVEVR